MANIQLNWNLPSGSPDMTNIDRFIVVREDGGTCASLQATAANAPAVGANGCVVNTTDLTTISHTDTGVTAGSWVYGVFAVNTAGANACLAAGASISSAVTVA